MKAIELVPQIGLFMRFINRRPMPELREALAELRARAADHLRVNQPPRQPFFMPDREQL